MIACWAGAWPRPSLAGAPGGPDTWRWPQPSGHGVQGRALCECNGKPLCLHGHRDVLPGSFSRGLPRDLGPRPQALALLCPKASLPGPCPAPAGQLQPACSERLHGCHWPLPAAAEDPPRHGAGQQRAAGGAAGGLRRRHCSTLQPHFCAASRCRAPPSPASSGLASMYSVYSETLQGEGMAVRRYL